MEVVNDVLKVYTMTDIDMIQHVNRVSKMIRVNFRWAFEKEYLSANILFVKAQEFLHIKQGCMIVRKFFTKLNFLAKYAPKVTSSDKGKFEEFLGKLRLDITKDVMKGNNPSKSLSEALGRALRSKAMR